MNNETTTVLAEKIMELKTKAERADSEQDYTHFMEEYRFLRKRWEAVAGNAVIGIEIPVSLKRAA